MEFRICCVLLNLFSHLTKCNNQRLALEAFFTLSRKNYNYQNAMHLLPPTHCFPDTSGLLFNKYSGGTGHSLKFRKKTYNNFTKIKCFGWYFQLTFTIRNCVSSTPLSILGSKQFSNFFKKKLALLEFTTVQQLNFQFL